MYRTYIFVQIDFLPRKPIRISMCPIFQDFIAAKDILAQSRRDLRYYKYRYKRRILLKLKHDYIYIYININSIILNKLLLLNQIQHNEPFVPSSNINHYRPKSKPGRRTPLRKRGEKNSLRESPVLRRCAKPSIKKNKRWWPINQIRLLTELEKRISQGGKGKRGWIEAGNEPSKWRRRKKAESCLGMYFPRPFSPRFRKKRGPL